MKRYEILFRDFKEDKLIAFYIFTDLARFLLYTLILSILHKYPLIQTSLILALNITFLIFIIKVKPFRSYIKLFFSIAIEMFVLIIVIG